MGWLRKEKIPKPLKMLAEQSHRWAGVVAGPPGSGKTTFLRAIVNIVSDKSRGIIVVSVKERFNSDLDSVLIPEEVVANGIGGIFHFTVEGIRPTFDAIAAYKPRTLDEVENILTSKFKMDVAEWGLHRLRIMKQWLVESNGIRYIKVPLYLGDHDELARRLVVGILYVARRHLPYIYIFDDTMAFILNEPYKEAALAMMRPYIAVVNRYLDARETLYHNPYVVTPGGSGVCAAA